MRENRSKRNPVAVLADVADRFGPLGWYLAYGLADLSGRQQRRQLAVNVVGLLASATSFSYAVGYLVYNPALMPMVLVACVNGAAFLLVPFVFNWDRTAGVAFGTGMSVLGFSALTHFIGADAGVHLFLFVVPGVVLVAMGPRKRAHILVSALACGAAIILCEVFFQLPSFDAANDPILQRAVMVSVVLSNTFLLLAAGFIAFLRADAAEDALEVEYARSESLLYNLLPEAIASRLKDAPDQTIADSLPEVAILFADIVDFTPRAAALPPEDVVGFLNRVFRAFDALAEKHGLEKIKTIGDAYMVAAGMPTFSANPVHRMADMALDMQRVTEALAPEFADGLRVRIGMHAGPAVAGVIGNRKLFYDVWGETVNTASRMESYGEAGRIQVTVAVREALDGAFLFEPRGRLEVKGVGCMETWWLIGRAISG